MVCCVCKLSSAWMFPWWDGRRSNLWGPIWITGSQVPWNKVSCYPSWSVCWSPVLCERIGNMCNLIGGHPYYAQVQGQMGCTGAQWCDLVGYPKKGMSIERITFDIDYWLELMRKLHSYFFAHFIGYVTAEFAPPCPSTVICYSTCNRELLWY